MDEILRMMMAVGRVPADPPAPVAPPDDTSRQFFPQITDLSALMVSPNVDPARDMAQMKALGREAFMLSDPPPETVTPQQRDLHERDRAMIQQLIQLMSGRYGGQHGESI